MENSMENEHTFVICAYKESIYLKECIDSLKNQEIKSRIIMVTSTENNYIKRIAKENDIDLFYNKDGGIGKDWNFALNQASTRYVTIAHQDDIYASDYIKEILFNFKKFKNGIIAFSNYKEIRNGKIVDKNTNLKIKELMLKPLKIFSKNKFIRRRSIALGNPICCPSVTYNIDYLKGFFFDEGFDTNLDWDAWERLSRVEGMFIYVPKDLMFHRIHSESETSNTINDNRRSEEDLKMLKKFWPKIIAEVISKQYSKSEKSNFI
ncbi:MAG: glycosyltransferase family 2 protein [Malacoplasma sp.]